MKKQTKLEYWFWHDHNEDGKTKFYYVEQDEI